jgi:hypothetical protein
MAAGDVVKENFVEGFDIVEGTPGDSPNDDGTITTTPDFKVVRKVDGKVLAHAGSVHSLELLTPEQLKELGITA